MSFHRGQHWYALCDRYDGEDGRRCDAFVLPLNCSDPCSPSAVLVPRGEVFNAAKAAGWEITYDGTDDTVLCPQHRRSPAPKPAAVVDVPLFDLAEVAQ